MRNPYEHVHDGPGGDADCPACIFAATQKVSEIPKRNEPTAEKLKSRFENVFGEGRSEKAPAKS